MIVVRIHGGLGNQMFQYALGRHLAVTTGQRLRLEIGMYNPSHLGRFDLDQFNIVGSVASRLEGAMLWRPPARLFVRFPQSRKFERLHRIYIQDGMKFHDGVLKIRRSAYLVGYWQEERYFVESADVIRRDYTPKKLPSPANGRLLNNIAATTSVAVHVRRGDYVTTAPGYGICDLGYYQRAFAKFDERVQGAEYFVFSDDIEWCKRNFDFLGKVTFVDNNPPEERHEDLRLMAACQHFIIANSSFSWWGAWLGKNAAKVVVAPANWPDVFPASWLRV